jgi:hypothetical protein
MIADCADLRIVPTLTRHALRYGRFLRDIGTTLSGYVAALLRLGAIARAGLACCWLMLGDALGVEALVRMRFRLGASGALFRMSARDAQFGPHAPACDLSDCADLIGL